AAHRVEAAEADALGTEEHVLALLPGRQAVDAEVLAPQLERLQVAQGQAVLVVARYRLAEPGVAGTLGVEGASAVLPAQVGVDEGTADAPAMVEAQRKLRQPLAGDVDQAVFDVVARAQMAQ